MDNKHICEICGARLAEYHFTKTSGGKSRTFHVCGSCKSILDKELEKKAVELNMNLLAEAQRVCVCGVTLNDIRRSGFAGCPQCYNTFREYLLGVIRDYQGSAQHKGRNGKARPPVDIESLYLELKRAVDEERFSDASKIKAQIDELRKEWEEDK
ncbi:MAG: hypothetical protein EOM87_05420 [Clostridia bacterium]|nr:hypothetical protein [Clostridia bacterium]